MTDMKNNTAPVDNVKLDKKLCMDIEEGLRFLGMTPSLSNSQEFKEHCDAVSNFMVHNVECRIIPDFYECVPRNKHGGDIVRQQEIADMRDLSNQKKLAALIWETDPRLAQSLREKLENTLVRDDSRPPLERRMPFVWEVNALAGVPSSANNSASSLQADIMELRKAFDELYRKQQEDISCVKNEFKHVVENADEALREPREKALDVARRLNLTTWERKTLDAFQEHGSLRTAARALMTSRSTVGRTLKAVQNKCRDAGVPWSGKVGTSPKRYIQTATKDITECEGDSSGETMHDVMTQKLLHEDAL